jgi:hypothetical protein
VENSIESVIQASIADLPGSEASEASAGGDAGDTENSAELGATEDSLSTSEEGIVADPAAQVQEGQQQEESFHGNNKIPYTRVKEMVAKAEAKAKAAFESQMAELNERVQRLSGFESPEFNTFLEAMNNDPERFLGVLSQVDPRYGQLIQARQQAQPQAQETSIEPDVILPDGSLGYSPQAMQRIVDARVQAQLANVEEKIAQRFSPIEQDWKMSQMRREAVGRVSEQIREAETWPGFNDYKAEITQAIASGQVKTLQQAYMKIVAPKLKADAAEMRKQIFAEINGRVRAASGATAPAGGPASSASDKPQDTEAVIREAIRGLKR